MLIEYINNLINHQYLMKRFNFVKALYNTFFLKFSVVWKGVIWAIVMAVKTAIFSTVVSDTTAAPITNALVILSGIGGGG